MVVEVALTRVMVEVEVETALTKVMVLVEVVEMVLVEVEMVVEAVRARVEVEMEVETTLVWPLIVSCSRKGLPTLLGEQVVCACNMQPFLTFCHHASIARFFFCHILGQLLTAFYHRTLAQSIDYFEQ